MDDAGSAVPPEKGPFRRLRRVDDLVFAVEKAVVVSFLIAITVLIFIDVIHRRLVSPDSKIGAILAAVGGVDDPATRATLDAYIAPWVAALLGVLLLWFGYWTAERHAGKAILPFRHSALALALASAAIIAGLGGLMLAPGVASQTFYLVLYALIAVAWGTALVRRRAPGWGRKLAVLALVITPLFAFVALRYMPEGYTWSQELSGILLLWVGFLGASICAHQGKHLRMEAFERMVPPRFSRAVRALGFLITGAFCGLLAYLGYRYVFDGEVGAFALGGRFEQTQIPDWIATAAVPVAFGLAMLRFFGAGISTLLGGTYGLPPTEESLVAARRAKAEAEAAASAVDSPEDLDPLEPPTLVNRPEEEASP